MEREHHNPVFAVLEARTMAEVMPSANENLKSDVTSYYRMLADEWDSFQHDRVSVVSSRARYIPGGIEAFGGIEAVKTAGEIGEWRNAATFLCARLAASPVNQSAAWVKENRSLTFSEIEHWNTGYRTYMDVLADGGHVVLKEYDDYKGIFIAGDNIKSSTDSDFKQIPERRRADKLHRLLYRHTLVVLNADDRVVSFDYLEAMLRSVVAKEMIQKKRLAGSTSCLIL